MLYESKQTYKRLIINYLQKLRTVAGMTNSTFQSGDDADKSDSDFSQIPYKVKG